MTQLKKIFLYQKTLGIAFTTALILGGTQSSLPENQNSVIEKTIDLSQYGTAASLDINSTREKIVISFTGCDLVVLDQELNQQKNSKIENCKRFFKARYGILDNQEFVISSIYTGESVLSDSQQSIAIPLHTAAVTDSLVFQNYLLSSSDDGSVQVAHLSTLNLSDIKSQSLYQSIGVARNLAYTMTEDEERSMIAVSYDSGEIAIFPLKDGSLNPTTAPNIIHPIRSRVNTFDFTPDGSKLLIGYFTGELLEFDLTTNNSRVLAQTPANAWLNSLDINNQDIVAFGDDQGYVKTVSLQTGQILEERQISTTGITTVLFIDDRTLLAADAQGILYQIRLAFNVQANHHETPEN
ncbi:unknown protein [[Synechococcus] sp. NIES-970]|nr:unknown protein [[Synechococcus] sp. NIES-970]